jgi:hypothetical protein
VDFLKAKKSPTLKKTLWPATALALYKVVSSEVVGLAQGLN